MGQIGCADIDDAQAAVVGGNVRQLFGGIDFDRERFAGQGKGAGEHRATGVGDVDSAQAGGAGGDEGEIAHDPDRLTASGKETQ